MLARAGSSDQPWLATRAVLVPDRHRKRSAFVACTRRQRRDMRLGQKLFAFFLGEGNAARLVPASVKQTDRRRGSTPDPREERQSDDADGQGRLRLSERSGTDDAGDRGDSDKG